MVPAFADAAFALNVRKCESDLHPCVSAVITRLISDWRDVLEGYGSAGRAHVINGQLPWERSIGIATCPGQRTIEELLVAVRGWNLHPQG